MIFDEMLYDGADPGGNLGGAFTASLAERELVPKGAYLHEIVVGLKHDNATAANTAEDSLNIIQPFVLKKGQETLVQLRGRDLAALHAFLYGPLPRIYEADAATDDFKVAGLRIPVWEKIDKGTSYTWSATRVALTNASGEVLSVMARWSDKPLMPRAVTAVELPFTSAAATGRTNLNVVIPQVGDLVGLILFNTNNPTNIADASSVQRLTLQINGERKSNYNIGVLGNAAGVGTAAQDTPPFDVLTNYNFIDLRDDPVDAKANRVGIEVDVEDASDACRIIPIMLKK